MESEAAKALEFLVTTGDGKVEIRWLEPLGKAKTGLYRTLEEEIEELDGVETVAVGRYSAVVEVAPHVATPLEVAEAILDLMTDPQGAFSQQVRFQHLGRQVSVDLTGRTILL